MSTKRVLFDSNLHSIMRLIIFICNTDLLVGVEFRSKASIFRHVGRQAKVREVCALIVNVVVGLHSKVGLSIYR